MLKKVDKENFIDLLASMSPVEMNELILTKGKQAKPVSPIFYIKKEDEEDGKSQHSNQ